MADSGQTEGLKLIGEWCKWLVAVQTGAIGLVGTLYKPDGGQLFAYHPAAIWFLVGTIVCFVFSIIVAGAIFSAIPSALTDIKETEKVMDRPVIVFNGKVGPFWFYVPTLFVLFVAGVLQFAGSVLAFILCG